MLGIPSIQRIKSRGFTLVELIIVISVIAIIAAIILIAYPGYQQRTRDNQRKSDLQQVSAAINSYALQKNNYITTGSGCGLNGNGNGWFNAGPADTGAGSYPQSIASCLQSAGVLSSGSFIDPSGCRWGSGGSCGSTSALAYMKATCTKGGNTITYLFARLETAASNNAVIDALCDSGSVSGFTSTTQKWGTTYGMNYYVVVR